MDFVTDSTTGIENPICPDSTAFLTLTVSFFDMSHSFPGDYDPHTARLLSKAEANDLGRVEPYECSVVAERLVLFAQVEINMRRLGTYVPL